MLQENNQVWSNNNNSQTITKYKGNYSRVRFYCPIREGQSRGRTEQNRAEQRCIAKKHQTVTDFSNSKNPKLNLFNRHNLNIFR